MRILGVRLARSVWLLPQHFANPQGIFLRRAGIEMKSRYNFLKSPFENATAGTGEAKYEFGAFKTKQGKEIAISSVVLHNDGLVADSQSSTEDVDAFVADVFQWLHEEHGLAPLPELPHKKIYASELNVALEKPAAVFNPKLRPFMDAVSSALDDGKTGPAGFLGFQLTTDPERSPRPSQFRFEREVNTSIDGNRYWSYAPLQTAHHVKLIAMLESCL